jgi:DNA helicase-2/ATP-dependent DNA helicase PcrA
MLTGLNEFQKETVLYNNGPMVVAASPGSGKTKSMTTKVCYLVNELGIKPSRIWSFTLTNKAADEMRERLEKLLGDKASRLNVSTIHSMAYQMLKKFRLNDNPNYKMPKVMVNNGPVIMHLYAFMKSGNYKRLDAKDFFKKISGLKMSLVTVKNFKNFHPYKLSNSKYDMEYNQVLHDVFRAYQKFLKNKGYMDYTDMLVDCYYEMMDSKNKDFLKRIQSKIDYITVDECQDNNSVSHKIAEMLMGENKKIAFYGDLRQCVYSFAGADIDITKNFITKHSSKVFDLPINYRSTKTIVENSNKFISYQKNVLGAPATTPNEVGEHVSYHTALDEMEEANYIADTIDELTYTGGYAHKDIAIIYRVHSQAIPIVDELMGRGIPHIQYVKTNFFLRKEVKDVLDYLRIAIDYENATLKEISTIIHKPSRFISNAAISIIKDYMIDNDCNAYTAFENVSGMYGINDFQKKVISGLHAQLIALSDMCESGSSSESIIKYICQEHGIGYEKYAIEQKLHKDPDADIRMDFDALIGTSKRFDSIEEFLSDITLKIAESKRKPTGKEEAVKLMSCHSAKGLEFPVVIVAGLNDRIFPFYLAVQEGNVDEERRVLYVAITRPEKKLYLSAINGKMGRFKVLHSPYLYQMDFNYNGGSNGS